MGEVFKIPFHEGTLKVRVPSTTLGGCCTARMGRDDVWVPNRGVDVNSHPRRAGYSRGNFSVMPGPHQRGHERSLGPGFPPAPHAFKGAVSPAFGLALYGGFLTRLSRALGAPDIFSGACRPSQTARLPLSPETRVRVAVTSGPCFIGASTPPGEGVSLLPPTLRTRDHNPTTGCSKAPRGLLAPRGVPGLCTRLRVHRAPGRDSGDLVDPFMRAGTIGGD